MNNDINLLQTKSDTPSSVLLKKITIIRGISLGLLFVISFFSILLYILIALSPLPSLQDREKDEIKKISQYHTKIGRILLTKERLITISSLLGKRIVYEEALQGIAGLVGSDMGIESLTLENKKITITISDTSLVSLDTLMTNILQMNKNKKQFSKASMISLVRNNDSGRYELTMELLKI